MCKCLSLSAPQRKASSAEEGDLPTKPSPQPYLNWLSKECGQIWGGGLFVLHNKELVAGPGAGAEAESCRRRQRKGRREKARQGGKQRKPREVTVREVGLN